MVDVRECLSLARSFTNQFVRDGDDDPRPVDENTNVHVLICALDYKQTANPLTCTYDARNVEDLCRKCGVTDVTLMTDEQCTTPAVAAAIAEVGQRCGENDFFVFYYSGHGTNLPDQDGDEDDGQDEAFCFVTPDGQINAQSCMRDDDFAQVVTENVPAHARLIIMTDCCHSGSIADLTKDVWHDFEAISITGCMDNQTSGDIGTGGIFTHSMLLAIEELANDDETANSYSVGKLFNMTLKFDEDVFNSAQDITITCTGSTQPDGMSWPFIPRIPYISPMRRAKHGARDGMGGGDGGMMPGLPACNLDALPEVGEMNLGGGCSIM